MRLVPDESASLIHMLAWYAAEPADRTAALFLDRGAVADEIPSFRDLDRRARAIASSLGERLAVGDRALLLYPPGLEFFRAFFGCLSAGVIAVPVSVPKPHASTARIDALAADAGVAAILTTGETLDRLDRHFERGPLLRSLPWIATDRIDGHADPPGRTARIDRSTVALLQYTSGTTSVPKGVVATHGTILAQCAQMGSAWRYRPNATYVSWLPHYHDMGLIGFLGAIYHGVQCVLMSPLAFYQNPVRWLKAISHYRGAYCPAPNSAYEMCVRRVTDADIATLDLTCWTAAINGAEPVRYPTLERFAERFAPCGFTWHAFCPAYGLAEATLAVTTSRPGDVPVRDASFSGCGRPLAGQRVVIVDPETARARPDGAIGEIWVRGPNVAAGYWNRPDETARTFRAHLANGEGPFLRTGDLGFVKDGELFVAGRLKDLIIVGGRNHYPQDIELTVENCHPALRPFSGVACAADGSGEEQLVIVQEVERAFLASDLGAVASAIRTAVSAEHDIRAHAIALVKPGTIPRTSSGKVQRQACLDAFLAGTLSVVGAGERR